MKLVLLLACLFPASAALIQYTSPSGDFSFAISEHANTESTPTENGYAEMFYIYGPADSIVRYTFSVTKIEGAAKGFGIEDLNDPEFEKGMLGNCGCEIENKESGTFKNLTGIQYKLRFPGSEVRSFSYTTIKGANLYAINFQANGADLDLYRTEYEDIMNSMEIFK